MRILALDLGQRKSVWCEYNMEDRSSRVGTVRTDRQCIHDLLVKMSAERLVVEAGPSAGWVHDIAMALGIPVQVANGNHEGWRWRNVKSKSDRKDALKLAQLSAAEQLPTVHMASPSVRQHKALVAYRHSLVERRTMIKNNIRSIFCRQGEPMICSKSAWTKAGVEELKKMARGLEGSPVEELWRGELSVELSLLETLEQKIEELEKKLEQLASENRRMQLLMKTPGVGPRLAEAVVTVLDDPKRFKNGRQVGSYVGLTPKQWQSGQMDRQGHISRAGNGRLRALLVEVCWLGLRRSDWMRSVYEKVRRGSPKRKKIAIVAVARRLLVRLWAMLRDDCPWRESAPVAGPG